MIVVYLLVFLLATVASLLSYYLCWEWWKSEKFSFLEASVLVANFNLTLVIMICIYLTSPIHGVYL